MTHSPDLDKQPHRKPEVEPRVGITLRQMQAFVAVADLGRFNLAASKLNITQSAVSILVKELEGSLQQRLFDRHTRMVSVTAAGRDFLPQARKILEDVDLAIDSIQDLAKLKRGRVTVASAIVLAATFLPPVIARFNREFEDISVQLKDMPEDDIRPALKRNEVDLAIGTVAVEDAEIVATPFMHDRLTFVCRADHRLANRAEISWKEIADEKLILLAKENPLRELVDRVMATTLPTSRPAYEVRFSTTAISMIAAGLGVAVLPENAPELAPRVDVRAVNMVGPSISREVSVLQLRNRALSSAALNMKRILLEAGRARQRQTGDGSFYQDGSLAVSDSSVKARAEKERRRDFGGVRPSLKSISRCRQSNRRRLRYCPAGSRASARSAARGARFWRAAPDRSAPRATAP